MKILKWAWHASKHVDVSLPMRLKFVAAALRETGVSKRLSTAHGNSPLGKLLRERPQTAGILLWPYQCTSWNAETRLGRLVSHLEAIQAIPRLELAQNEKLVLVDLSSFSPGVTLIIDRPLWLAREGLLTLSIFKDDFRAFTVSFSLSGYPSAELFIGGLQGRQSEDALTLYRDLTKAFEGIRPRDFILEMLRLFALHIGVREIHAVADDKKISRHEYFGTKPVPGLFYDDVWRERSGERVAETHFQLPLQGSRRPLAEVAAKKRSMYRRRYEMLDQIEAMFPKDLAQAELRFFEAT